MGTLRTLFAISVVCTHTVGFMFVGGRNAVQMFYMISGFLISYVLIEKRSYTSILKFYVSRYLRLYPIYIVVAVLTLVFLLVTRSGSRNLEFFNAYHDAPLAADVLLIFSNTVLFLQDWIMFLGVEKGDLVFSSDWSKSEVVLFGGLLVPQAWTLGVELTFYLLAPFVLTQKRAILLLLFISIAIRFYLIQIGVGWSDPWSYRFFPTELAFFLLGSLAHQLLLPFFRTTMPPALLFTSSKVATGVLVLITISYGQIPLAEPVRSLMLFSLFLLLMPLAFVFQEGRDWDKWVGDLSYPIYICHLFVVAVVTEGMSHTGKLDNAFLAIITVILSIFFSLFLNAYVARPVEVLRKRFRNVQTST